MIGKLLFFSVVFFLIPLGSGGQAEEGLPHVPDYLVESRVEKLNLHSPVPLNYNAHVQAYVDVYTLKRPDHLARILGLSEMYFPLFEEYLDKYGLPLELKYLPVIESALDPRAKSSSGAYGLWQFLYQASRMFDLEVTSYVDERADPVKATDAACRYLKYLYHNFNDWLLVIAAYNGGIGAVKDAIAQSGGERDFWKLRAFLPEQVRGYVPAFIAANYVMNHYSAYGIEPAETPFPYQSLMITTIQGGISFNQISELTGISNEVLQRLNPSYKMDYIPVNPDPVKIVIPEEKLDVFHEKRPRFRFEEAPPKNQTTAIGDTANRLKINHTVAPGEFFHEIAMKYHCRIEDLQVWNDLAHKDLFAGQKLTVWKPKAEEPLPFTVLSVERDLNISFLKADAGKKDNGS